MRRARPSGRDSPAREYGWSLTDARTPLSDPFGYHGPVAFDESVTFTDRFCDRLEAVYQSVREHNRERHLSRSDRDGDGKQAGLENFSEPDRLSQFSASS